MTDSKDIRFSCQFGRCCYALKFTEDEIKEIKNELSELLIRSNYKNGVRILIVTPDFRFDIASRKCMDSIESELKEHISAMQFIRYVKSKDYDSDECELLFINIKNSQNIEMFTCSLFPGKIGNAINRIRTTSPQPNLLELEEGE